MIPFKPGSRVGHVVDPATGCWIWQGAISKKGGYGVMGIPGTKRTTSAQIVYYERAKGRVPPRMDTDHLCRNRLCVNPEHLEVVTRTVNARRGAKTKLSDDTVREILARYREGGVTQRGLASEYGIHHAYISQMLHGKRHSITL